MKKMMKIILGLLLATNLYYCERAMDKKYPVYLINNAGHSIGCYLSLGGDYGILFPDTILPTTNKYIVSEIKSGSRYIYDSGIEWVEIYSKLPQDTMSVFIFHSDTLKKYSWEEMRTGYKVLRRYDLSLDDLKKSNYTITYP